MCWKKKETKERRKRRKRRKRKTNKFHKTFIQTFGKRKTIKSYNKMSQNEGVLVCLKIHRQKQVTKRTYETGGTLFYNLFQYFLL